MVRSKYLLTLAFVAAFGASAPIDSILAQTEDATSEAQAEAPSPRSPLRVNSLDYEDSTGKLTIAGVALPGNELYLYFDDQPLGKVIPNDEGQWSIASDLQLGDNRHTLRAEQFDPTTHLLAARATVTIGRAKQPADGTPKTP